MWSEYVHTNWRGSKGVCYVDQSSPTHWSLIMRFLDSRVWPSTLYTFIILSVCATTTSGLKVIGSPARMVNKVSQALCHDHISLGSWLPDIIYEQLVWAVWHDSQFILLVHWEPHFEWVGFIADPFTDLQGFSLSSVNERDEELAMVCDTCGCYHGRCSMGPYHAVVLYCLCVQMVGL